jgi:hypothetical protein
VKKEQTEKKQPTLSLDEVMAKWEDRPPLARLLQAFEELDCMQPLNNDARDVLRGTIVPIAIRLMARLQAADHTEEWKYQPEEARLLSDLIDGFFTFVDVGPPFGSGELFQREKLDQDEQAWRPWNPTMKLTPYHDNEDDDQG